MEQNFCIFISLLILALALSSEVQVQSFSLPENESNPEIFEQDQVEPLPLSIPDMHLIGHREEETSSPAPPLNSSDSSDSDTGIGNDNNRNQMKTVFLEQNCSTEDFLTAHSKPSNKFIHFTEEELQRAKHGWGGNCTEAHWKNCSQLSTWTGSYKEKYMKEMRMVEYTLNCTCGPVICLRNGWTVTRCSLLCMSKCNREYLNKYDKYVKHQGKCQEDDIEG